MVIELAPRDLVPASDALRNYHSPFDADRQGRSRRAYRDFIVSSYLGAIESNYGRFVSELQGSDRGSALGLDLLVLGLTGVTALAGVSDVEEWATVTAVATGARATVDKRLFFDRTLPAVLASMDAERAVIRSEIARKRNLPIEQYSLDEAIDDLHRLQQAGRLDRAVTRMTRVAEADREEQETRLNAITTACDDITPLTGELNLEFRVLILGTDAATRPDRLRAAADELGLDVAEPSWSHVNDAFDTQLCDNDAKRRFIDNLRSRLEAATGGEDDGEE